MTRRWRHKRTGGVYVEVARGCLQMDDRAHDDRDVVVYRSVEGGLVWVRPADEFAERFEPVSEGT